MTHQQQGLFSIAALIVTQITCIPSAMGQAPVAWWRFDEATSGLVTMGQIQDSFGPPNSVNVSGNNGGVPEWVTSGVPNDRPFSDGIAIRTGAGSDTIDFGAGANDELRASGAMTIWGRVRPNLAGSAIVSFREPNAQVYSFRVLMLGDIINSSNTGNILFEVNQDVAQPFELSLSTTQGSFPLTEWWDFAVTFQPSTGSGANDGVAAIYRDGQLIATTSHDVTQIADVPAGSFLLGQSLAAEYEQMRVYNRALTATEILELTDGIPPSAVADTFQVQTGQQLSVNAPGVLTNDTDPEGNSLTAVLGTGPSNADAFRLNPDGSFGYTPTPGFTGTDSFTYTATNGTNTSAVTTVTIDVTPIPPSCIELLRVPADNYQALVQATLATEVPAIQALAQSGDVAGASTLQQSTITALVQEAANAVGATQIECANCIAQLQADGNDHLVPNVNNACVAQIHRIGTIQAGAVSQLESAISRADPTPVSLMVRDRYLREIGLNSSRTISSFGRFISRYGAIVNRHQANGDTASADAAVASAGSVLQRTSAARIRRIQELCDNFAARAGTWPGSHHLIATVTSAATAAMAEIQLAEAEAMREIEAAEST